jgi:hypothetical protein
MKNKFRCLLLIVLLIGLPGVHSASAQDGTGGAWGEVVNPNGSINYDGMTDNGVVTKSESFMPTIPGVGQVNAEYHSYTTQSGNQVLMPTTTTLFFMAMDKGSALYTNPTMGTSGLSAAGSNNGTSMVGTAFVGKAFGLLFGTTDTSQFGGSNATGNFFPDLISGQQNIWQLAPSGITNLLGSFYTVSVQDHSLYTYMIMMPGGTAACGSSGCANTQVKDDDINDPIPTAPPTMEPTLDLGEMSCPGPKVIPGRISFDGFKTAPDYPLVVGQDPDKRGVDFEFSASVAPTKYITYKLVLEYSCDDDCEPGHPRMVVDFHCVSKVEFFEECIATASGTARLTQTSRDWILNELSIRYPEAYLHKPVFSFSSGGGCAWQDVDRGVQIADPGYWDVFVNGRTSGTPVSGPRDFGGKVDTFEDWLKEIAIIK